MKRYLSLAALTACAASYAVLVVVTTLSPELERPLFGAALGGFVLLAVALAWHLDVRK